MRVPRESRYGPTRCVTPLATRLLNFNLRYRCLINTILSRVPALAFSSPSRSSPLRETAANLLIRSHGTAFDTLRERIRPRTARCGRSSQPTFRRCVERGKSASKTIRAGERVSFALVSSNDPPAETIERRRCRGTRSFRIRLALALACAPHRQLIFTSLRDRAVGSQSSLVGS